MNFLKKHVRIIFILIIIAFVSSIFVNLAVHFSDHKNDPQTLAIVNNVKIPMKIFDLVYISCIKMYEKASNKKLSKDDLNRVKMKIIYDLIQEEIFYQQSKCYKIVVDDEELKTDLQNSIMFKGKNGFDIHKYRAVLNFIKMTPNEYETIRKKQIAASKISFIVLSSIKLWNHEFENSVKQDPTITREFLINKKVNLIAKEWYLNILKNSKIIINDTIID
ncbi:MAG: SurA N-terminal domain-containing protein [Endomicrobium sp.]|jgi:hypothetical protein|nr:SurA N-terminal domain-containing protein [Endomicrobium sp.]